MQTEADRHIEMARQRVREAIHELGEIVVNQCPGTEDYKDSFCLSMAHEMNTLITVSHNLNPRY